MTLKATQWTTLLKSIDQIRNSLNIDEESMSVGFLPDGLYIQGESNGCLITVAIKRKEQNV